VIWFLPGLLFCAIAQTVLLNPLSVWGIRPDLFFLLVFLISQRCSPETGTILGFSIGLCQDGLSGAPLGLHAFTDSLLGFLAARLSHHMYTDKPLALFWLLLGGSAAAGSISLLLLTFFQGPELLLPALLRVIAPEAFYTAAAGLLLLWLPQIRAALTRPI
jgi:rod shape-determining protein MreD